MERSKEKWDDDERGTKKKKQQERATDLKKSRPSKNSRRITMRSENEVWEMGMDKGCQRKHSLSPCLCLSVHRPLCVAGDLFSYFSLFRSGCFSRISIYMLGMFSINWHAKLWTVPNHRYHCLSMTPQGIRTQAARGLPTSSICTLPTTTLIVNTCCLVIELVCTKDT